MTSNTGQLAILLSAALLLAPGIADAQPGKEKGKGRDKGSPGVEAPARSDLGIDIRLGDREAGVVRDYFRSRSDCPPGLAKKNNGCLPPGIAKKRYAIGEPIYDDAVVIDLPYDVAVRLPPLPRGREYRVVDGDLVVVAVAGLIVLDAIGVF